MIIKKKIFNLKNKELIIVNTVFVLLSCFIVIITFNKPKLDLESNQNEIILNLNSDFSSPKAVANYMGIDVSDDVKVESNVNTNEIGEYEINYEITKGFKKIQKKVKVKVTDLTPPVIELKGSQNVEVCSIDNYIEEGYIATDNIDKDITNNVQITIHNDKIVYSVTDLHGNKTEVERTFIFCDSEAPKIILNGETNMYITLDSEFKDPGATATDNCDKNLNVKITGKVDTKKAGVYILKYEVVDSAGNSVYANRNVYVYNPQTSVNLSGGEASVVYLTFDDGPGVYTNQILSILDKYNIKATFFVTGSGADELILKEYQNGHTVGIHTFSHKWDIYSSRETYMADLNKISQRVKNITGEDTLLMRFPGGSSNTVSRKFSKGIMTYLTSEVLSIGYHYFDWNISVEDAGTCAKKSGYNNKKACILNYYKKGLSKTRSNIVLMHDIKQYTADSLEEMIQYALANGYTFDKITMDTEQIHSKINN